MSTAVAHELALRVYFEDTDVAGVLYHASAIRFFDRGRSEYLHAHGTSWTELRERYQCVLAVHELQVRYLSFGHLDDQLMIRTTLTEMAQASLWFAQDLLRDGELLAQGRVRLACVDTTDGTVRPMPQPLRALGGQHG